MNKVIYTIISVLALTSCANSFHIAGSTSVSMLDGQKLYLKVMKDTTLKDLDSCDVVHGQFQFGGSTDSVRVASIILDDNNNIPVVLEDGDIQVKIDNSQETVTGTPLMHQHDQAIMNGRNMDAVNARLAAKDADINRRVDKLVTTFVTDNMDNVLGPYIFINVCMNRYNVPMLDAWVEDIMSKATDKFKNDPQVKEYYEAAQENQNIMNGTKMPEQTPQPAQQEAPQDGQTPNEMAK